jgi:predicted MFS family arabinose efflux permease
MTTDSMSPPEIRAVVSLAGLYALRMLGLFMVLPVISLYGPDLIGYTPALLGLAIGAYGLTQALLQIPFGLCSDRIGRKPIIVIGLIIFALGSVVAAQATTMSELIIGRCIQGGGAIASTLMALLSDLTREENRTKAMASVGASIGLSFSVALVLGPLLSGWVGLSGLFWLTAIFACAGIFVVWKIVPTPLVSARHRDAGAVVSQIGSVLKNKELLRLDAGIMVLHGVLVALFIIIPSLLVSQVGLDKSTHWWVYLPIMLLSFVLMVPFIIIGEKKQRMKEALLFAIALMILSLSIIIVWPTAVGICSALLLFFIAFNLLEASLPSLISKISPAAAKGTAMGAYSSSQFMGAFIGGALGGWILQEFGVDFVLGAWIVGLLFWWCVALFMATPNHLSSYMLSLEDVNLDDAQKLVENLLSVNGVDEAVVIPQEKAAYLKVNSNLFDKTKLQQYLER